MKTNLILTGWHYPEYMAAAAAMLRGYNYDADVYGTSMASLASTLRQKGPDYKCVDILGVGLTENLEELAEVLRDFAGRKIRVNWYSREKMPAEASSALAAAGAAFANVYVKECCSLLQVVGELVDSVSDLDIKWLKEIATADGLTVEEFASGERKNGTGVQGREIWPLLYKAAGFAHRDHQDEDACSLVVKGLLDLHDEGRVVSTDMKSWPTELKNLMSCYQAGGNREFIGKSVQVKALRRRLAMAAACKEASVLLLGETGSGKGMAAEYIHSHSDRRNGPYVHYNCANATNENMLEDVLFGHVKYGFTDAKNDKKGLVECANGGTLFLDEIATASKSVQSALLVVLETGRYKPVGTDKERKTDIRLVCATNEDIQQMVLDGTFRHDLYERICQFPVEIAPLREHLEDVKDIGNHIWRRMTGRLLTKRQLAVLQGYDYSGNVRELGSILLQAKTLGEEDFGKILAEHERFNRKLIEGLRARRNALSAEPAAENPTAGGIPDEWHEGDKPNDRLDRLHHAWAVKIYEECSHNLKLATERSGVSRNTFKKYLDLRP